MKIGIDALSFYCPRYYLDLRVLAEARGVDANKYIKGLGQERMAVAPPDEDIVTMAASAGLPLVEEDADAIDTVLFATESGIDQSKAAAIYAHNLLSLPSNCRAAELKQACYSATIGLRMAAGLVAARPERKILVLAADIARYGLGARGEPTQGAGAVAMLVSANPRLLALDDACGCVTQDVMDFWRPNYMDTALVDGHYSTKVYLETLLKGWEQYRVDGGYAFDELSSFCYHLPFTRMAVKAHHLLAREYGPAALDSDTLDAGIADSLTYNRVTGNTYSASLYEGLCSLLDHRAAELEDRPVGLFSYGSGCVAEFFSGTVQGGCSTRVRSREHNALLDNRVALSIEEYEAFYTFQETRDGSKQTLPVNSTGPFRLAAIEDHKRIYKRSC
jgi:hydroxymethylglutaryl-CoA synthase